MRGTDERGYVVENGIRENVEQERAKQKTYR